MMTARKKLDALPWLFSILSISLNKRKSSLSRRLLVRLVKLISGVPFQRLITLFFILFSLLLPMSSSAPQRETRLSIRLSIAA